MRGVRSTGQPREIERGGVPFTHAGGAARAQREQTDGDRKRESYTERIH